MKTGLAWCPKPDPRGSAALYAINMLSNICTRAYQGLKWSPKIRREYWAVIGCNHGLSVA